MKNKDISLSDAYRIYTGHRFGRSVLSAVLLALIFSVAVAFILTLVMLKHYPLNGSFDYRWHIFVYSLLTSGTGLYFIAWLIIYMKRLGSVDAYDRNAAGGKYLCTVKGRASTFAKAHIMMTAEQVLIVFLLMLFAFFDNIFIYRDSWDYYAHDRRAPLDFDFILEISTDIPIRAAALIFISIAVTNLCLLHPNRNNRIILTAVLFPLTTLLSIAFVMDGGNRVLHLLLSAALLAASEYVLIKKKNKSLSSDVTADKTIREGAV